MNKLWWIASGITILLAIGLRFWNLATQGIFYYDEAFYRLTAQTYVQLPQWYSLVLKGMSGKEAFAQVFDWGFFPQIAYKPTYLLLLMGMDLITGVTNPASGAYLSAILGLGIIAMIFILLRQLTGNRWVALTGAFLATVSGIEVSYSRMTFPHQLAALLLLTYSYFYLKRLQTPKLPLKYQYFLGMGAALLLTSHDLMLPILGLLVIFELCYLLWQRTGVLDTVKRGVVFLSGVATPLFFWEIVTLLLREFFSHTLKLRYVDKYFKQVLGHVTSHEVSTHRVLTGTDFNYYFKVLNQTEGALFIGFFILGLLSLLIWCWQKRDRKSLFITYITVSSLGLISIYPSKVLRLLVPFFPMFILLATLGIYVLGITLSRWNKQIATALSLIVIVWVTSSQGAYSLDFTQRKSGYATISNDLKKLLANGDNLATAYHYPIYTLYLQKKVYAFKNPVELQELIQHDHVRYISYEFEQLYKLYEDFPEFRERSTTRMGILKMEEQFKSGYIRSYPNPYRSSVPLLLEGHYPYDIAKELVQNKDKYQLDQIRLYAIKPE